MNQKHYQFLLRSKQELLRLNNRLGRIQKECNDEAIHSYCHNAKCYIENALYEIIILENIDLYRPDEQKER